MNKLIAKQWHQSLWILYLIAIATLCYLFLNFDDCWATIRYVLKHIQLDTLLLMMLFTLANLLIRACRWHFLVKRIDIQQSLWQSILNYLSGFAFTLTPGKVGEQIRIITLKQNQGAAWKDLLMIALTDRWLDSYSFILLLFGWVVYPHAWHYITCPILAMLTFILLPSNLRMLCQIKAIQKLITPNKNIGSFFASLAKMKNSTFLLISALSSGGWLLEVYALKWLINHYDHSITYIQCLNIFTLASLSGLISLIPGGVGGFELNAIYMLTKLTLDTPIASLIIISFRISTIGFSTMAGLAVFLWITLQKTYRNIYKNTLY
jgi:uncharacterized protein (TIRG00374 family)